MKPIFIVAFFIANTFTVRSVIAQNILSEAERESIIQQIKSELKQEFLDSIATHSTKTKNEILDTLSQEKTKRPFGKISDALSISGYLETFYNYDFANPSNHVRHPFMYAYNRHNEINLHLGLIKLAYSTENIRANIAFMAGTYSNDNMSAEPGVLKNIYEANVGFKVSKKKNLWIDAGVMPSHIGFESAIGKDCWTLTRSILAENSPYFETGAKITYTTDNGKWTVSGLVLNGWQRIYRKDGNNFPAFGHQLIFKPNSNITLNSSSFLGNDMPDSTRQMRYFHDLYGQFQLHKKVGLMVGFDIGAQQITKKSNKYNIWYSPIAILKVSASDKISIAARAEYYNDANGVIIYTGTPNNFKVFGYSLNLDYLIHKNVLWRLEGRGFYSKDEIFTLKDQANRNNFSITTSLALSF